MALIVSGGNLSNAGHLRVTVSPAETTVEYVRSAISGDTGVTNGQIDHPYTISPNFITLTGVPLAEFSSLPGAPSAEQIYTVAGNGLTDDIVITAPSDFEISLTSGSGFASSLTLPQSGGSVPETTIYVRFNRGTEGTSSGEITHSSGGVVYRNVAVTGTAAPLAPVEFSILLGRPTDQSATANIIADMDAEFYIEYGDTSESYSEQTGTFTAIADDPTEIVIDGLSANTEYFYRIVYRQTGTTDWNPGAEHSFDTQRAPGSTFTFTIASDSHLGQYGGQTADEYALYERTLQNILADQPDFHIDDGDTFAMDPSPLGTGMTEAEADAAYYIQRPYLDTIGASVPVFLAIGNHENEEGWNWDDDDHFTLPDHSLAIVGLKARKKYFPNPIPDNNFYTGNSDSLPAEFLAVYPDFLNEDNYHEDYFAWTWGDALFVVIDPYHYSMTWPNDEGTAYGGEGQDGEVSGDRWDWTLGIEQYLWLKDTLENSDATYKFVFSHQVTGGTTQYGRGGISAAPYFEWGGQNLDGSWGWDTERPAAEGWTVPIHQLFIDNGVNAYFHGHDHIYAREELDGIVYLEVPKPDDAGYDWDPYGYGYNEDLYLNATVMLTNSGHMRVTVSPAETTIEYVRSYLPGDGTNGVVADSVTVLPTASSTHTLTVAVDPVGGGTTDPAVGDHTYLVGTEVAITATANADYVFDHWEGDVADPDSATTTVTMDANKSVTAHFLNAEDAALADVIANTTLTGDLDELIATFPTSIPAVIVDEDYTINSRMTLAEPLPAGSTVTIQITVNGTGPIDYVIDAPIPTGPFWVTDLFDPAAVAADFDAGYGGRIELYNITINSGGGNPEPIDTTLKVESIISKDDFATEVVLATLDGIPVHVPAAEYTLSVISDHGSVTQESDQATYHYGDVVTLTAAADTGWAFSDWSGDVNSTENPVQVTIEDDMVVTATYIQEEYTLEIYVDPIEGGSVTVEPDQATYHYGDVVTLTATANADWVFDHWTGAVADPQAASTTVTMYDDRTVFAYFTNTNLANLTGTVTLQRQNPAPDPSWSVPLTVELYEVGQATPAYSFTPTTNDNGEFTISGITPGTYEIAVKNSHTLQVVDTVIIVSGGNNHAFGTLLEGDANDDNFVTGVDFSILSNAFGTCEGETDFDDRADFNEDTCVTGVDFSLLSYNFQQSGENIPE